MWLVRIIYWLQAFAAPVILFGLIALWVYSKGEKYPVPAILLLAIGVVTGVVLAEYIRRKIGLETFFSGISDSRAIDEKLKEKKKTK
jgi:hypothetical protein